MSADTVADMAPVGDLKRIPEFNDCQRFIRVTINPMTRDTTEFYDSVFAVYATPRLSKLAEEIMALQDSAQKPLAVVAAVVVGFGGAYPPLGIESGYNCLYMFADASQLRATMVKAQPRPACPEPIDTATLVGWPLTVRRTTSDSFLPDDYPPVARWDWDSKANRHYIGLRCGEAWCEIGNGFRSPSPKNSASTGWTRHQRRVRQIKGWYDLQRLAITGAPLARRWRARDAIKGLAFPHESLGTYSNGAFQGTWLRTARIVWWAKRDGLNPNRDQYKTKLNFDRAISTEADAGARWNARGSWISLCAGGGCVPDTASVSSARPCGGQHEDRWWAKIEGDDGSVVYRCVKRMPHVGVNIPGAVRWRWRDDDETVWVKCGNGCCEVDP